MTAGACGRRVRALRIRGRRSPDGRGTERPDKPFAKLQAKHGTVIVVVGQPAPIGALPLSVARDRGCPVTYLPGLTMRRIADLYPGEAKTDAKDAFITAGLETIVSFDDDLAGEATRVANRLHGLLPRIRPLLERVLGSRLQHPAVLTLLERFGSPAHRCARPDDDA